MSVDNEMTNHTFSYKFFYPNQMSNPRRIPKRNARPNFMSLLGMEDLLREIIGDLSLDKRLKTFLENDIKTG